MGDAMPSFEPDELAKLKSFRSLAAELHPYVAEYRETRFSFNAFSGSGIEPTTIPEDPFGTMARLVRQAYLEKEDTNFHRIANIVGRRCPELRADVARGKESWKRAFRPRMVFVVGEVGYDTKRQLDTYFNGKLFHRHASLATDLRNVESFDDAPVVNLQVTILELAECVVGLDRLLAHALSEESLPRLG